jgi:hypothetical protein
MFGFANAEAAQGFFDHTTFEIVHIGILLTDGANIAKDSPAPAQTIERDGHQVIQINYDYSWLDFSHTPSRNVTTGVFRYDDYLKRINDGLGSHMTSDQLAQLIILHEVAHAKYSSDKATKQIDSEWSSEMIYDNCIK